MRAHELTGRIFGKLRVLERAPSRNGNTHWTCKCACGERCCVSAQNLLRGVTKSCGCYRKEKLRKHGLSGTRTYVVWKAMHKRCTNPRDPAYENYGARGIQVCRRWKDYALFLRDLGECPPGLTLERRDNNKDYAPANCYWATRLEQGANNRRNRLLTLHGETTHVAEWARRTGMSSNAIIMRLKLGWTDEETLTAPLCGRRKED